MIYSKNDFHIIDEYILQKMSFNNFCDYPLKVDMYIAIVKIYI